MISRTFDSVGYFCKAFNSVGSIGIECAILSGISRKLSILSGLISRTCDSVGSNF